MKKPITHEIMLAEIIRLAEERRVEVESGTTLRELHFGKQSIEWMFDWLHEKFPEIGELTDEHIKTLTMGSDMDALARLAMKLLPPDATYEDGRSEDMDNTVAEEKKRTIHIIKRNPRDSVESRDCQKMSRSEFLEKCGAFFDARGTHVDDFEEMHISLGID